VDEEKATPGTDFQEVAPRNSKAQMTKEADLVDLFSESAAELYRMYSEDGQSRLAAEAAERAERLAEFLAECEAQRAAREVRIKKREDALKTAITAEDIAYHSQFLVAVPYGNGFCWLYARRSRSGRTGTYARLKFHGVWVQAHRFALACKLKCTLWELQGSYAGHAKASICLGGPCSKHTHLKKEPSAAVGAWQRAKDKKQVGNKGRRSAKEVARLVRYTNNLPISDSKGLKMGVNVIGEGPGAFTIELL